MSSARLSRLDGGRAEFLGADGLILAVGALPSPAFLPPADGLSELSGGLTADVIRSGRITRLVLRTGDGRRALAVSVGPVGSSAVIKLDRTEALQGEVVSIPRIACLSPPED